jgi:hypothetical protein
VSERHKYLLIPHISRKEYRRFSGKEYDNLKKLNNRKIKETRRLKGKEQERKHMSVINVKMITKIY